MKRLDRATAVRGAVIALAAFTAAAWSTLLLAQTTPTSSGRQDTSRGNTVLLVHSYHTGYPWVDAVTRGVRMALSRSNVKLEIFHMDTKRHTEDAWKQQAGEKARQIVAQWKPDVVIAADDNAQQYFAKDYAGKSEPQIVFCGVNAEPEAYGYPASNVTGVLERPHFRESLGLFQELVPGAHRIALVCDDSETSAGGIAWMKKEREKTDFQIVSVQTPAMFQQWQEAIARCQGEADAIGTYMYHTVKQPGRPISMEPKEVMAWTVENSKLPIIGFVVFAVDDGALCGFLESGVEHGFKAGQMAAEILRGRKASDFPMVTALEGQSMLNLNTARRLEIHVPQKVLTKIEVVIGE